MSRYFNQTQQTLQKTDSAKLGAGTVDELLGVIKKESNAASGAVADARLEKCRKLPLNSLPCSAFIAQIDQYNWQAAESYRALRTRLLRMQSNSGFRSVVITSAIQGDGKTLTAINLALCCAQLSDMKVLLVDSDLRR